MEDHSYNVNSNNGLSLLRNINEYENNELLFNINSFITNNGSRLVSFTYKSYPLLIQTPILTCSTGFRIFSNNDTRNISNPITMHSLMLSCTNDFVELMTIIDNAIMDAIMLNSEKWFNKKYTNIEILKELYNSSIKYKQNYPPSFSGRLKFINNEAIFGLFDSHKKILPVTDVSDLCMYIPRKTNLKMIITCNSIWFSAGRCGISWDITQIKICDTPHVLNTKNYMFIDDDDEEK